EPRPPRRDARRPSLDVSAGAPSGGARRHRRGGRGRAPPAPVAAPLGAATSRMPPGDPARRARAPEAWGAASPWRPAGSRPQHARSLPVERAETRDSPELGIDNDSRVAIPSGRVAHGNVFLPMALPAPLRWTRRLYRWLHRTWDSKPVQHAVATVLI